MRHLTQNGEDQTIGIDFYWTIGDFNPETGSDTNKTPYTVITTCNGGGVEGHTNGQFTVVTDGTNAFWGNITSTNWLDWEGGKDVAYCNFAPDLVSQSGDGPVCSSHGIYPY
jgi:hypothetical protein